MQIDTRMDVRLATASMSTIRTWLLIANLIAANGSPLVGSFSDISEVSKRVKPISKRGVSRGVRELEGFGMLTCDRRGNVAIIELVGAETNA